MRRLPRPIHRGTLLQLKSIEWLLTDSAGEACIDKAIQAYPTPRTGPAICVDAFGAPGRCGSRSGAEGHVPQADAIAKFNEERAQLGPTLVKKMTKFKKTEWQKLTPHETGRRWGVLQWFPIVANPARRGSNPSYRTTSNLSYRKIQS